MNWLCIRWMKIIFWFAVVLNWPFYYFCNHEYLTVKSTLGRNLLGMGGCMSLLAVTGLVRCLTYAFVYLNVDETTHICPSYFEVVFWGWRNLMLKPFEVSVWRRFIYFSSHISCMCGIKEYMLSSWQGLENTPTASLQRVKITRRVS